MLKIMENETSISRLTFSDYATFLLKATVSPHNVRIWETNQPHGNVKHEIDSPKAVSYTHLDVYKRQ